MTHRFHERFRGGGGSSIGVIACARVVAKVVVGNKRAGRAVVCSASGGKRQQAGALHTLRAAPTPRNSRQRLECARLLALSWTKPVGTKSVLAIAPTS